MKIVVLPILFILLSCISSPIVNAITENILYDNFENETSNFNKWTSHSDLKYESEGAYAGLWDGTNDAVRGALTQSLSTESNIQAIAYIHQSANATLMGSGHGLLFIEAFNGYWYVNIWNGTGYDRANSTVTYANWEKSVIEYDEVTGIYRVVIGSYTQTGVITPETMTNLVYNFNGGQIDNASLNRKAPVSAVPSVNEMVSLIGIMGLLGIGLPLLSVSGGSPTSRAIKIVVYIIVVGALISSAFGWF